MQKGSHVESLLVQLFRQTNYQYNWKCMSMSIENIVVIGNIIATGSSNGRGGC